MQIPFHNAAWINRCKNLALKWGIKTCVWGGDAIDLSALSVFIAKAKNVEEELTKDEEYLKQLASGFTKIIWLMGNHEEHFRRRIGDWLSSERVKRLIGLEDRVEISDYYWCLVGKDWQIEHPANTSEIAARAATWLAEKYRRNVGMFHNHLTGYSQTRDGDLIGIDVGMSADEERLEYVKLRHNKKPKMTNGALILRWDAKERKYYPHHLTQHTDFPALERIKW